MSLYKSTVMSSEGDAEVLGETAVESCDLRSSPRSVTFCPNSPDHLCEFLDPLPLMNMCMRLCVCVYVHVCACMCMCLCFCVCMCVHACACICVCTCVRACMCACVFICVCAHAHAYMCVTQSTTSTHSSAPSTFMFVYAVLCLETGSLTREARPPGSESPQPTCPCHPSTHAHRFYLGF